MPRLPMLLPLLLSMSFLLCTALAAPAHAAGYATDDAGMLYEVIPDRARIERVGRVEVKTKDADGSISTLRPTLTDLALSDLHGLYGISFTTLYRIDFDHPERSARIGDLRASGSGSFNALAFDDKGRLFALERGTLFEVDVKTGRATQLGSLGGSWSSDGDLAWFGGSLYATVGGGPTRASHLVRVDVKTGKATALGPIRSVAPASGRGEGGQGAGGREKGATGGEVVERTYDEVWGLIWDGRDLHGVTPRGELIRIDHRSGRAVLVTRVAARFYGACAMLRI